MQQAHWEHFEHGADIGVRGIGTTLAEAFEETALALSTVITDLDKIVPERMVEIDCEAPDPEMLLVDWLNALIYEMASRKMLFKEFDVSINQGVLHARLWGESIDPAKHQPTVEVKGATYTALKVFHDEQGIWHAQTVVDV
jgi:SHS2 domain-containing protein